MLQSYKISDDSERKKFPLYKESALNKKRNLLFVRELRCYNCATNAPQTVFRLCQDVISLLESGGCDVTKFGVLFLYLCPEVIVFVEVMSI